ncbi:MAG: hypothetical protein C0621_08150 [Desulfuromonas sp.]|nr:MAG: hypothetical protein C0621_08150 [Desulfuromonas sp.]
MKRQRRQELWCWLLAALVLLLLAGGCSSKHKLVPGAPDWVNQGSGAFEDDGAKVFYGVGVVRGISSPSLSVQTADQRARADVGRQLETYISSLFKDYQSASTPTIGGVAVEEQHVEESLKAITQVSVRGSRVIDHWREPESGTVYSLVRLDLEGVQASFVDMPEIESGLRDYLTGNADKAFDTLRLEEEKGR